LPLPGWLHSTGRSAEHVSDLYELIESPELDSPTLLLGLDGWIDAGLAATNAFGTLLENLETVTVARFDADSLIDHRSRRPTMHLLDGITTGLTWPTIELQAGFDADGASVLFLVGAEPDHRWMAFADAVDRVSAISTEIMTLILCLLDKIQQETTTPIFLMCLST